MEKILSKIDVSSGDFLTNSKAYRGLLSELKERVQAARLGGGQAAIERHRSRGKMTARERIERLRNLEYGVSSMEYRESIPTSKLQTQNSKL